MRNHLFLGKVVAIAAELAVSAGRCRRVTLSRGGMHILLTYPVTVRLQQDSGEEGTSTSLK